MRQRHYIAVIADVVGSRNIERSQRRALQRRLTNLMASFNRDFRAAIASKFVITLGDEFQSLLQRASVIPDLIWRLEEEFPTIEFRVSFGFGTLDTTLPGYAINLDGPALHAAREAIEEAKKKNALGGIFLGLGDLDEVLNGIARLLWFNRSHWTLAQRKIANLLRKGLSQTQVAKKLKVRKQVVSKQVLASGYVQYKAAEDSWRAILEKWVDPLLGSK